MMFWKNLEKLMSLKALTQSSFATEIGIHKTLVYQWRDGSLPSTENLIKIADYFNISIDELVGRVPLQYSTQEIQLLNLFKTLSDDQKQDVINYADFISRK